MSNIKYDPSLNPKAGFLVVGDHNSKKLAATDRNTLLRLMFELTYTESGRKLLADNRVSASVTEAKVRENLKGAFTNTYGLTDTEIVDALIEGHLAADRWVKAQNGRDEVEMAKQQSVYQQNMAAITWQIWEDFNDHEFSMNW